MLRRGNDWDQIFAVLLVFAVIGITSDLVAPLAAQPGVAVGPVVTVSVAGADADVTSVPVATGCGRRSSWSPTW